MRERRALEAIASSLTGMYSTNIIRQREDFLVRTRVEYRGGLRPGADTQRNGPMPGVSNDDIRAIAHHLSHRQWEPGADGPRAPSRGGAKSPATAVEQRAARVYAGVRRNTVTRLNEGPLAAYRARVAAGVLRPDPAQAHAAELLQDLWRRLRGYSPPPYAPPAVRSGLLGKLFGFKNTPKPGRKGSGDLAAPPPGTPMGLYLVGEVGRGKSMLMDLFFETAEVGRKTRIHFHAFMQLAHRRIHEWKMRDADAPAPLDIGDHDPIPPLADSIVAEAHLLCFDEFQVHDIADAMILGRLFEALFARGAVVVATSNTAPKDLFRGRPGRDAFLPFIALIERRLEVLQLESAQDYRRQRMQGLTRWHVPADGRAERALDAAFLELTGAPHGRAVVLSVHGRQVEVPEGEAGVARMGFDALCGANLGPGDYLALARHFHTLLLDGVPRLGPENFDKARRFITLVDALYDHRCQIFASAAALPDQLYERGQDAAMFERTASRLVEMQSLAYFDLPHLP